MTRLLLSRTSCCLLVVLLIGGSVMVGPAWNPGSTVVASTDASETPATEVPRLAGWVLKGLTWQLTPPVWETEAVIAKMRSHGVNAMRRHFASAPLMEQGNVTRAEYFRRWHTVADWAAQQGMWVIYDFYDRFIARADGMRWVWQMPEDAFLAMWRLIAREMQGHGNVLLELGNEPDDFGVTDPSHRDIWLQRCMKAIAVIREEGFQGYIVIPLPECATWAHPVFAYRQQVVDADPLDRFMWDFHYYWLHHEYQAGSPEAYTLEDVQGWLDTRGISALRATGDRVLCGEMGVYGQNPDPRDLQWFQNLLTILNRDGYDMICEAYQPNHNFPQLTGEDDTTDWYALNTQGTVYVSALPPDLSYYTYPSLNQDLPLLGDYPRAGANKRSPGGGLGTLDQHSPVHTIHSIRGVA